MTSIDDKLAFMSMTLDDKIKRTKQLIMEWYAQFDGKVYVSFSGGKDSTVLLHIARNTLGCSYIVNEYNTSEIIPEQCTGLKDKNDQLIYEGDLIKIDDDVVVINWSDYYARFMLESSEDIFDFERSYAEECEVIGNIHENANLIKVGGK